MNPTEQLNTDSPGSDLSLSLSLAEQARAILDDEGEAKMLQFIAQRRVRPPLPPAQFSGMAVLKDGSNVNISASRYHFEPRIPDQTNPETAPRPATASHDQLAEHFDPNLSMMEIWPTARSLWEHIVKQLTSSVFDLNPEDDNQSIINTVRKTIQGDLDQDTWEDVISDVQTQTEEEPALTQGNSYLVAPELQNLVHQRAIMFDPADRAYDRIQDQLRGMATGIIEDMPQDQRESLLTEIGNVLRTHAAAAQQYDA